MQVAINPHEHFLDEILSPLAIAYRTVNEIQKSGLVPLNELGERPLFPFEEGRDDCGIVHLSQLLSDCRPSIRDQLFVRDLSHASLALKSDV
jgi:hypothetical protein